MQIGIFSDVHANLRALQAVLAELQDCDELVHPGDAISIGPFPRQCLELLLERPNLTHILDNHDRWYVDGLPQPQWMGDGEVEHQNWTHNRIGVHLREKDSRWKFTARRTIQGIDHTHHSATYDDTRLMSAFDEYQVPEREFLRRIFFGGR